MRYFLLLENSEIQEVFAKDILSCPLDHSGFKVLAVATSEKAIKETKKILMGQINFNIMPRTENQKVNTSSLAAPKLPVSKPGR